MKKRKPTHPGEILKEDVFPALGLSASRAASILGVSRQYMGDILNAKKAMTPVLCLKIGKLVGNVPEMWMAMQSKYDLWEVSQNKEIQNKIDLIPNYKELEEAR